VTGRAPCQREVKTTLISRVSTSTNAVYRSARFTENAPKTRPLSQTHDAQKPTSPPTTLSAIQANLKSPDSPLQTHYDSNHGNYDRFVAARTSLTQHFNCCFGASGTKPLVHRLPPNLIKTPPPDPNFPSLQQTNKPRRNLRKALRGGIQGS
jgi:hypothetical protein